MTYCMHYVHGDLGKWASLSGEWKRTRWCLFPRAGSLSVSEQGSSRVGRANAWAALFTVWTEAARGQQRYQSGTSMVSPD